MSHLWKCQHNCVILGSGPCREHLEHEWDCLKVQLNNNNLILQLNGVPVHLLSVRDCFMVQVDGLQEEDQLHGLPILLILTPFVFSLGLCESPGVQPKSEYSG
jgi:hypothetical protein